MLFKEKAEQTPLEQYLKPVKAQKIAGNCNACFLHGTSCCNKMSCSYCDGDSLITVYWRPNEKVSQLAPELAQWFDKTRTITVLNIAEGMMRNALFEKKRGI